MNLAELLKKLAELNHDGYGGADIYCQIHPYANCVAMPDKEHTKRRVALLFNKAFYLGDLHADTEDREL